jgi:uncharacterized protein with HEPN domain
MRPQDRDSALLWDMRHYARIVAILVENRSFAEFEPESTLRLAVERSLEIVGEAARQTSEALRSSHPEIPWVTIIGQRNVLAHAYASLRGERLWETATQDMLPLIEAIDRILPPQP